MAVEMSYQPDWEGLKAAFDSENPDDEIIIIQHRVVESADGKEATRQVHVLHKLGNAHPGAKIAEALINNALNGQQDVDELIACMQYLLSYTKTELDRLRGHRALHN